MDVVALLLRRFIYFHRDAMRVGPGVLTDASHLPGHLHIRLVGSYGKAAFGYFRRHDSLRKLPDDRQLIAEIRIERFEPIWHRHDGSVAGVGDDCAVVNVLHVRRFDEGVVEVFVGGIERMIDFEGASGFAESASDLYISVKETGIPIEAGAGSRIYPIPGKSTISPEGIHAVASRIAAVTPRRVDAVSAICAAGGGGAAVCTDAGPASVKFAGSSAA